MGGGGDEGGTGDKRVEYLRDRVVPLLKIKPELFDAYCKTEEGELIKRFVSDGNCTKIFFSAGAKDMAATEKMPDDKQTKKKAVFAMKLGEDIKFDEKKLDEMFDKCVVADLSPAVLNNLYNTLRSVYLPILTNPGFINGKPGIVMKQFVDKYNWMLAAVHTAMFDQMTPEHIAFMLSKIPMGRFGKVEEIAAMVTWLCTDDCSFSTGAVFDLSGGRSTY
jgi:hypothetical protein